MMKPKAVTLYYYVFTADVQFFCFFPYKAEMQYLHALIQCMHSFMFRERVNHLSMF